MIIIDVTVPALSKTYEFTVNENVLTKICADEISEIICKTESVKYDEEKLLILIKESNQKPLFDGFTLMENGVINGDRLILI